MVIAEHDAPELVGELLGIDVGPELALLNRGAHGTHHEVEQVPLGLDEVIAGRAGPIVELGGGGDQRTAARQGRRRLPREEALEDRPEAGLSARRFQGGSEHLLDEAMGAGFEDLHLQRLLRLEVCDEAALRHAEVVGEAADRQALDADARGQGQGMGQDRLARLGSLGRRSRRHGFTIERTFVCVNPVVPRVGADSVTTGAFASRAFSLDDYEAGHRIALTWFFLHPEGFPATPRARATFQSSRIAGSSCISCWHGRCSMLVGRKK